MMIVVSSVGTIEIHANRPPEGSPNLFAIVFHSMSVSEWQMLRHSHPLLTEEGMEKRFGGQFRYEDWRKKYELFFH